MDHNAPFHSRLGANDNPTASAGADEACPVCDRCPSGRQPDNAGSVRDELSITQAVDLTRRQRELLSRAQNALDQVALLASAASNSDLNTPDFAQQFQPLARFLGELSQATFEGVPVFGRNDAIVTLPDTGNKLVMPGIHLCAAIVGTFPSINLSTMACVTQLLQTLRKATHCLAIDRALIGENLHRLSFLSRQLEQVRDVLVVE